jgi:hypothetical protein
MPGNRPRYSRSFFNSHWEDLIYPCLLEQEYQETLGRFLMPGNSITTRLAMTSINPSH